VSYGLIDSTLEVTYWSEVITITDGGSRWARIGPEGWNTVRGQVLAVTPSTPTGPSTIYSSAYRDYDLCWTSDDGATFTCARLSDTPALVSSIAVDPQDSRIIYAGTSLGVYKSEDGGASWKALNSGLTDVLEAYGVTTSVATLAIAAQTSPTLYAGTDVGLFESVDSTEIWTRTGLFQQSLLKSVTLDAAHVEGGILRPEPSHWSAPPRKAASRWRFPASTRVVRPSLPPSQWRPGRRARRSWSLRAP
jgi:hypothetical protein